MSAQPLAEVITITPPVSRDVDPYQWGKDNGYNDYMMENEHKGPLDMDDPFDAGYAAGWAEAQEECF